ncbi:hypothetical protein NQ318_007089 [Aromia moschata]|uniref:MADF domain-containing protein n=1 Tax=Aromia moschata TaxID=1265417 RepID=A0AAV8XE24_9CUCU|nr:hypothetical protein NQ318_007089 [Aromia moschata]
MDEFLIECVRKHPVLYNMKSTDYMDQKIRQEAWEEVGRDVKMSDIIYEIRTEIKRLGRPIPDLIISKTDVGKSRNYSRNFNSSVYDRFKWLCGCPKRNKLFCFICLVMGGNQSVWTQEECVGKAENAKEKWNKLRRCFWNAINRRRCKKSGRASRKLIPWKFQHQMQFLLPFLESRATHGNIEEYESQMSHNSISADLKQEYDIQNEENEDLTVDMETENEHSLVETDTTEEQNVGKEKSDNETIEVLENLKRQKRAKLDVHNPVQQIIEIMKENANLKKAKYENKIAYNKSISVPDMDETDMFFLSMSRMTKQLPRFEQSKIKLALSNVVLQAEMRNQEQRLGTEQTPNSRQGFSYTYVCNDSENHSCQEVIS